LTAPQAIMDLIERFDRNVESYRSGKYNETQVRLQFINPFFKALGWDVYNEEKNAEAYKDVYHEDAIKSCKGRWQFGENICTKRMDR